MEKEVVSNLGVLGKKVKKEMRDPSHIPLWLDGYHEMFSGFDPRPYKNKALSNDFLTELKRASIDKIEGKIEIKLFVPLDKRNKSEEIVIKKRLIEHFKKHFNEKKGEQDKIKKDGLIWACIGILLLIGIVFSSVKMESLWLISLINILEVPGWFFIWSGLAKILIDAKERAGDYIFYKKMSEAEVSFLSY